MTIDPDGREIWLAYNAAENDRHFDRMLALVSPDLTVTVNGRPAVASAEEDETAMRALIAVYPDYRREVEEVISIDHRAVARWRMRGTSSTRSQWDDLDVAGCSVVTCRDGRIVDAALYYDGAALDRVLHEARS